MVRRIVFHNNYTELDALLQNYAKGLQEDHNYGYPNCLLYALLYIPIAAIVLSCQWEIRIQWR